MKLFEVKIVRETVDELTICVEADSKEAIDSICRDAVYETADGALGFEAWNFIDNEITINIGDEISNKETPQFRVVGGKFKKHPQLELDLKEKPKR